MTHGVSGDDSPRTDSGIEFSESNSSDIHSELTGFQRDLLLETARFYNEEGHYPKGVALKSRLEAYYDDEITHGRLYPNLDTLVRKGLVSKDNRNRRTNEYQVSEDGWSALRERSARVADAIAADISKSDDTPDTVDEEPAIALPEGVTVDDVETAASEHETLGMVAEAIGVTRGRARAITHATNCYSQVRDAPSSEVGQ